MKIIDLLTKYANGGLEKIRVKCNNSKNEWYDEDFLFSVYRNFGGRNNDEIVEFLNDEVEIIEESKKVEMPKHLSDDFTGLKWYADGICFAYVDCSDKLELKQDVICADNPKKVEIPKHIPNAVIQDLNRTVYPGDVKCIAHKINEIINYLQYKEKKEEQED